jgi:hypothetical protein
MKLASKVIDKHLDPDIPAEERDVRRRELLHGPSVFRDMRKDHTGADRTSLPLPAGDTPKT